MNTLAKEIVAINQANGWNVTGPADWFQDYKIPAIIALIHSEASEALEAFRANDRENFEEELAGIVIRVLDLAGGMEIDIAGAIRAKLEKNKTRVYWHGGKRV